MTLRQRLNLEMFAKSNGQVPHGAEPSSVERSQSERRVSFQLSDIDTERLAPSVAPSKGKTVDQSPASAISHSLSNSLAEIFPTQQPVEKERPSHPLSARSNKSPDTAAVARDLLRYLPSPAADDVARADLSRPSPSFAIATFAPIAAPGPPTPAQSEEAGESARGADPLTASANASPTSHLPPTSLPPANRRKNVMLQIGAVKAEPVDLEIIAHRPSPAPVPPPTAPEPPQEAPHSSPPAPLRLTRRRQRPTVDEIWGELWGEDLPSVALPSRPSSRTSQNKSPGCAIAPADSPFSGSLSVAPSPTPPSAPMHLSDRPASGGGPPPSGLATVPEPTPPPPPPPAPVAMSSTASPVSTTHALAPAAATSKVAGVFSNHQSMPLEFYVYESKPGEGDGIKKLILVRRIHIH